MIATPHYLAARSWNALPDVLSDVGDPPIPSQRKMPVTTPSQPEFKVVGTNPIRRDAYDKVTGRAVYGADVRLNGLVWGEILRSPHAHARIKSIDLSGTESLPGVLATAVYSDLPIAGGEVPARGAGLDLREYAANVLANDRVQYRGHPIAAVAAIDRNIAREALDLIHVEYEVLKPVMTVEEAMASDAPIIRPGVIGDHLGEPAIDTNILRHFRHELGDPERGFADSSLVIEREFQLSTVHQGYLEPHNATAQWSEDGQLTIWSSSQGAHGIRDQIALLLNIPPSCITVMPVEIGGGFGGKALALLPPVAAVLAKKTGRPVKLQMDRKDVLEATDPAPGAVVRVKMGVNDHGKILAATADVRMEGGAITFSSVDPTTIYIFAPYNIPNCRSDGYEVVVNKTNPGAYRAPGSPQAVFPGESMIDEICDAKGFDKLEFRLKNASEEGTRTVNAARLPSLGFKEVYAAAMATDHWNSPLERDAGGGKRRGRGVATGMWGGGGGTSCVNLALNADSVITLTEGSADLASSRLTVAMQAAEILGIPVDDVRPSITDTDSIGYTEMTGGSRVNNATGQAAIKAAYSLIARLKTRAASLWGIDPDDVAFDGGVFSSASDPELKLSFRALAARLDETGGPLTASASVSPPANANMTAAQIVDVEVDTATGKVSILRYTAIQDVGKAVHPKYVEGQIQGGVVQGLGWALNEEYVWSEDGAMQNASLLDYRTPTALDVPPIEVVIVEVPSPMHPFGARGVGEVPIGPPPAAVRNAIHDATGVYLYETPLKPGRILEALGRGERRS